MQPSTQSACVGLLRSCLFGLQRSLCHGGLSKVTVGCHREPPAGLLPTHESVLVMAPALLHPAPCTYASTGSPGLRSMFDLSRLLPRCMCVARQEAHGMRMHHPAPSWNTHSCKGSPCLQESMQVTARSSAIAAPPAGALPHAFRLWGGLLCTLHRIHPLLLCC